MNSGDPQLHPHRSPDPTIRARLEAACASDELISPLDPRALAAGTWRGPDPLLDWPPHLLAGVLEARAGYRFRPENLALPTLLHGLIAPRVIDLGAGSGSLLLLAAWAAQATTALGVEIQPAAHDRLTRTLAAHDRPGLRAVCADLRDPHALHALRDDLGAAADLIVANPPFYAPGWGRPSANPEVHASTHALHGDATAFLQAARALLAPTGRVAVVFDAVQLHHLIAATSSAQLGLDRLLWIPDQRPDRAHLPTRCWMLLSPDGAPIERLRQLPAPP